MHPLTLLVLAVIAAVLVVRWFVHLEREGRPEVAMFLVVAAMLVEAILFQSQADTPQGLFRPGPMRTWELLLIGALIARAIVRGFPERISTLGAALLAFLTWYSASALIGVFAGNPWSLIQFQAKLVLHLGGAYLLARGVPTDRLFKHRPVGAAFVALGVVVLWMLSMSMSQASISVPALGVPYLGPIGADASSVLAALGITAILVAACGRARYRLIIVLASLPLLLAPIASTQRASIIALGASAAVVLVAAFGSTWRRRITITPTEAILTLLGLLIPVLAYVIVQWNAGRPILPQTFVETAFESTGNQQSAEARKLLWAEGRQLTAQHPFLGSGLGTQFSVPRIGSGSDTAWVDGAFHNIGFDLVVRSGFVGAALFTGVMVVFVRDAWRAWRGSIHPRDAALALAAVAITAGFLAKGAVESVLEKGKLATVIGLVFGTVARIAAASNEAPATVARPFTTGGRVGALPPLITTSNRLAATPGSLRPTRPDSLVTNRSA